MVTGEWYTIHKSSLGVHSLHLKARDQGHLEHLSQRDRLLLELGRNRFRELQLVEDLVAQGGADE